MTTVCPPIQHYEIPTLASTLETATTKVREVPVVRTPPGRWTEWASKRLVVTRHRDGDDLTWRWGLYTNRLRRLTRPDEAG